MKKEINLFKRKSKIKLLTLRSYILLLIIYFIYNIYLWHFSPNFHVIQDKFMDYFGSHAGITVTIGNYTKKIQGRAQWQIDHICPQIDQYPNIHVIFTSDISFLSQCIPVVVIPKETYIHINETIPKRVERRNTQIGVSASLKHSLLYFLNKTRDNWYMRIDDDSGIYLPNLQKALIRLQQFYNSKEKLIFGSYTDFNGGFIGGGTGIILSRAGAESFLENFEEWIRTENEPNDKHFNQIISLFNMTFADCHFPGMPSDFKNSFYRVVGDSYLQLQSMKQNENSKNSSNIKYLLFNETIKNQCKKGDKWYKFNHLPIPNEKLKASKIAYPLNDIFVYHHYWSFKKYKITWNDLLDIGFTENVYYYKCNNLCHICIAN